jgi:hypothetical protein
VTAGASVNKALVIAHGVHETGRREILSIDVGEAETEAFWTAFLRGLIKRGLVGVQLAISDAHAGLKPAIAKVLGCAWQRCTVHFLRDCLGHARKDQHGLLAALIRRSSTPTRSPRPATGSPKRSRISTAARKVAAMLEDAEPTSSPSTRSRPPLAQAALDEPARALQPRDRPPHRSVVGQSSPPGEVPVRVDGPSRSSRGHHHFGCPSGSPG